MQMLSEQNNKPKGNDSIWSSACADGVILDCRPAHADSFKVSAIRADILPGNVGKPTRAMGV